MPAGEAREHILAALEGHARELRVERRRVLDARVLLAREDLVGVREQVLDELGGGRVGRGRAPVELADHELHARPAAPLVDRDS